MTAIHSTKSSPRAWWVRGFGILYPSRVHSIFSASLLLGASSLAAGLVGLARGKYIAWLFGAGPQTDAYMAAFRLPDLMNNFLVGGAVSITFVTILNRYQEGGEERQGEQVFFTVLNLMVLVLTAASIFLTFFARPFVRWTNPGFPAAQVDLCAHITRILLPAQIFLFAGSVLGAPLLVRKHFLYQAATPLLYNLSIIVCGVLFHRRLGVSSLAVGATAGCVFGSLGINAWGLARAQIRYRWVMDLRHAGLRMWFYMTLPLMFGFALPYLDPYFAGYYASQGAGDITRLANAKQLFAAPLATLTQAAGTAWMPFFAKLWATGERYEFAVGVADAVSRIIALSFLAASLMMALSLPIVSLIFGGGRFTWDDVSVTALFFTLYTISLFVWSAQAIYARAFSAAGITGLPVLASTSVLLVAIPLYGFGYRMWGAAGLAVASDAGIILQTVTLALLLHKRRMVSIASLDIAEMSRCLIAATLAGFAAWLIAWGFDSAFSLLPSMHWPHRAQLSSAIILIAGLLAWVLIAKFTLENLGSALPRVAMRRLGLR